MKNLIAVAMFTMFAVASVAAGVSQAVPANETHAAFLVAASEPRDGAEPGAFDPVCTPAYVACTADCQDLSGGAKGACLRLCRAEYEECLAH